MYMKSVASSDGTMQLTVTFQPGTDVDAAQVQVQNRVQQALPRLPEDVRRQVQEVIDNEGAFVTYGDLAAFICR